MIAEAAETEVSNHDLYAAIRSDLTAFCRYQWDGFELGPPDSHVRTVLDTLKRVQNRELRRVLITIPPRHYKTSCLQRFIAHSLGKFPDRRFMYLTYGADLAEPKSREIQDIVRSPEYGRIFPEIGIDTRSASVSFWRIANHKGHVIATGIGGAIGGHGATDIVIDDPFKDREEADSQVIRDKVFNWYTAVAYTRLEPNPAEGVVVVLHTRWHQDDLIGRLKKAMAADPLADQWTQVDLPAMDREGRPLWFKKEVYEHIKVQIGPRDWAALYQGSPIPDEGALFRESDFIIVEPEDVPPFERMIRYWDLALGTKQSNDFTAGAKIALDPEGNLWILDVVRMREEWPEVRTAIIERSKADKDHTYVAVEDVAHQGAAIQHLRREPRFLTVPLIAIPPRGPKDSRFRAAAWAAVARAGKLRLVRASWNHEFISECLFFPNGEHDDQVDAVSGGAGLMLFTTGDLFDAKRDDPSKWTPTLKEGFGINSERHLDLVERAAIRADGGDPDDEDDE